MLACKKETVEPQQPKASTQAQTSSGEWKIKSVINYSTSTMTPSLLELQAQSADTTYYEIHKNGVVSLKWKMGWTYTSTPSYQNVDDLKVLLQCKKGDTLQWRIIHKSPRNISSYTFNGAVTLIKNDGKNYPEDYKTWFTGMFFCHHVTKDQEYYEPNRKTFVQYWQGIVE